MFQEPFSYVQACFSYLYFGKGEQAKAYNEGAIVSSGKGQWSSDNSWNGLKTPNKNNAIVHIKKGDEIAITGNVSYNGTIYVDGVLMFNNGKLRMGKTSQLIINKGGVIKMASESKQGLLKIGGAQWRGKQINLIGVPNLLCGKKACDNATAVALSFFTVRPQVNGKSVALEWQPVQKATGGYFVVEKSYNGKDFKTIGAVQSTEATAQGSYAYEDKKNKSGEAHYRLKYVLANGTSSHFNALSVKVNRPKPKYKIDLDGRPFLGNFTSVDPDESLHQRQENGFRPHQGQLKQMGVWPGNPVASANKNTSQDGLDKISSQRY